MTRAVGLSNGCRTWATALLLTTATAGGGMLPAPAAAQTTAQHNFDIPAQPLSRALVLFGRQAGLQVVIDGELAEGVQSPGVKGTMNRADALSRMLVGTGLTFRLQGNTATLARAPEIEADAIRLGPVRVEGNQAQAASLGQFTSELPQTYAGGQIARGGRLGALGNTDVMDSPFSTSSLTQKYIQDQQAISVSDAIANDPSVRTYTSGFTSSAGSGDNLYIRGFNVSSANFLFDGVFGITYTVVPVETMERIEVLKGPSAFLNGIAPRGAVGGMINVVPKRAADVPTTSATLSYLSDGMFGGHLDIGRRFGAGGQWGVRVNAVYRNGDTPQKGQSAELGLVTAALDFRGEQLRGTLDVGYVKQDTTAPTGAAGIGFDSSLSALPAPKLTRQIYQNWEYMETEAKYVLGKLDYDLGRDWMIYAAAGYSSNRQEALSTDIYVTDTAGNGIATVYYSPIFGKQGSLQAGIRGQFATEEVSHALNINGSYYFEGLDQQSNYYGFSSFGTNIYHAPTIARPSTAGFLDHPPRYWNIKLPSISLSDTMGLFDSRLLLTLGARYQAVKVDVFNPDGSLSQAYDESAVTPAVAAVFKPAANLSIYANYVEGLQQGPTAWPGTTNAGQMFPPIKTDQFEMGVKYDLNSLLVTASVFQIRRPNGILTTDQATGLSTFSVNGEQRNRGVELTLSGEPVSGLRLLGGLAYTVGKLTRTDDGAFDGNAAVGVPRWQGNMGIEWEPDFAKGLTLTGRATMTGSQYSDSANLTQLSAWTRFDIGARYRIERGNAPITLRAAVENLFARNYWAGVDSGWVTTGTPRTVKLSATMDF